MLFSWVETVVTRNDRPNQYGINKSQYEGNSGGGPSAIATATGLDEVDTRLTKCPDYLVGPHLDEIEHPYSLLFLSLTP